MRSLRDGVESDIFYAESWALVHFLHFGPGMLNGGKLNQFQALLQGGTEQKKAFQTAFGDIASLEANFNEYVHRFEFNAGVLNNPPAIDEKSFRLRKLNNAESDAELGSYHLWTRDVEGAKPLIERAIQEGPSLGLAHEDLGFLYFAQNKDEEAEGEFSKAFELDPSLFLSLYYGTMLSQLAHSETPGDQAGFREAMLNTLKINPDFAPAYVELAMLDLRQNKNFDALAAAVKAEKLEPTRAGYRLLTGKILLRLGQGKEASDFARYVAERWSGPDHDEAAELWNEVPEAQRTKGDTISEEIPKDTQTIEGQVHSITCADKTHKFELVIDHDGKSLAFHSSGRFMSGFSDTLWYGEDHFSGCYHLDGMRAIVRYKPPADSSYAGDVVEVEYRQDLPKPALLRVESTPQTEK
jgi:tetratricopeptide (TPR) repeat protein